MTDAEVQQYLEDNGYPPHVVQGGLPGLIQRWTRFVDEVERGYEFGMYDYRNDLDGRGILHLVGADSDPTVERADERLRGLLVNTGVRLWESVDGDPWWDFGYPANISRDFRRDLQAEGLWQEGD